MTPVLYGVLGFIAVVTFFTAMTMWAILVQAIFGKGSKAFATFIGGILLTLGIFYASMYQ